MSNARSKSVIVTGGASGIGRAVVLRLARTGHRVTIADRDESLGNDLATEVGRSASGAVHFIQTDVTDAAAVERMVNGHIERFGGLDGAVNSAGIGQQGKPLHELTFEDWDRCNAVNLRGMFLCLKYEMAAMVKGGGGAIVAVSSVAAVMGLLNSAEYCASKAGVTGLVRAAAIDGIKWKIRINGVLPGGTATPLAMKSMEMNPALAETLTIPVNRLAEPDEIAAGAAWLISDESSYVTGTCLSIDGAMSIA